MSNRLLFLFPWIVLGETWPVIKNISYKFWRAFDGICCISYNVTEGNQFLHTIYLLVHLFACPFICLSIIFIIPQLQQLVTADGQTIYYQPVVPGENQVALQSGRPTDGGFLSINPSLLFFLFLSSSLSLLHEYYGPHFFSPDLSGIQGCESSDFNLISDFFSLHKTPFSGF